MKKSFALLLFFCAIFTMAQERKHTATENVKIISEKFEIPQLKTTRRIWIYLPKDYETSHKKYEVMYLQDAQNLFDDATSYAGEWQVDETLNKIFEKTGKSLIVVGIDNGGEKRIEELSPYKNAKYGGTILWTCLLPYPCAFSFRSRVFVGSVSPGCRGSMQESEYKKLCEFFAFLQIGI